MFKATTFIEKHIVNRHPELVEKLDKVSFYLIVIETVADTIEAKPILESPKGWKKVAIIAVLCSAQFFDIFNACASIAALPSVCIPLPIYHS